MAFFCMNRTWEPDIWRNNLKICVSKCFVFVRLIVFCLARLQWKDTRRLSISWQINWILLNTHKQKIGNVRLKNRIFSLGYTHDLHTNGIIYELDWKTVPVMNFEYIFWTRSYCLLRYFNDYPWKKPLPNYTFEPFPFCIRFDINLFIFQSAITENRMHSNKYMMM